MRAFIGIFGIWSGLVLLLAACSGGTPIISEDFQEIDALPETLRTEDLLATTLIEGRDMGLLRLIVEEPGRNQNGKLWLNLEEPLADAALEARIRIRSGQARFWLRTDERLCAGYVLTIDPTLERYRLSAVEPDCSLRTLDDRSRMEVNLEEWYDVRFEARGSTISGTIDSVRFFEVTDDTFQSGAVALQAFTDGLAPGQVDVDWLRLIQ